MSCKYEFVKWAGKKIGDKYQGQRVGGAVFKTECGTDAYGYELMLKPNCIFCGEPILAEETMKQFLKDELGIHTK